MFRSVLISFILFFIFACSDSKIDDSINGEELYGEINSSLRADNSENITGLFVDDLNYPPNYNKFLIDSVQLSNGRKVYSILIEYPVPVYNIFALIDDTKNILLADHSLNGKLGMELITTDSSNFIVVEESFRSNDIIELQRLSFYKIDSLNADLILRFFSKLNYDNKSAEQKIINIADDKIITEIISDFRDLEVGEISYNYSVEEYRFVPDKNNFTDFVNKIISETEASNSQNQISDKNSLSRFKIKETSPDTGIIQPNEVNGYQIEVPPSWEKIEDLKVTEHLSEVQPGIRYLDNTNGLKITLVRLDDSFDSEKLIDYKYENETVGNYKVRFTNLIEKGKNYIQFFEHSCSEKMFLLIFEGPKYTYDNYKEDLNNIINSFFIEC